MRNRGQEGDLTIHGIAGTYVVTLGMDIAEGSSLLNGLLGFAIHKKNEQTGKEGWLPTYKVFPPKPGEPPPEKGKLVSSKEHPVQGFLWSDYTTYAATKYTYTVTPQYGVPGALVPGASAPVTVTTENESDGTHAVFFNRGAAASQAYARKFDQKSPDEVGPAAYRWLSRGLSEALTQYIRQATDGSFAIRAAVYEFQYAPILNELKAAADRGADVRIVYDAKAGAAKPGVANTKAVNAAGLTSCCRTREQNSSYIAHNKFFVLLKDNVPFEVWTGSTNISDGGIFGHSNVGHIIRDGEVARVFFDYWEQLWEDPEAKDLREWADEHTPLPDVLDRPGIIPVFSPRGSLRALEFYRDAMDRAQQSVFLTAAFGVNALFQAVLATDKPYLRYLLLEREDKEEADASNVTIYRRDRQNLIAVGDYLTENVLEQWLNQKFKEERLSGLNKHVRFIHTKFMLVDALTDDPTVITGSANFSDASTRRNDENMVIIRGDTRVTDIYLGEFMRLYEHYRFRKFANEQAAEGDAPERLFLSEDASWLDRYYEPDNAKMMERTLFA